jgi:hypothetical protein
VDAAWNPNPNNWGVLALAMDVSGSVYVGGQFTSLGGVTRNRVAKLSTSTGAVDATWNADASDEVRALAVDSGGAVFAGGHFRTIGGLARNYIAKLSGTTGGADATWNPDSDFGVNALKLDGSGGIYVGGDFGRIGGVARANIARISAGGTGAADPAFDPAANSSVRAFALDATGNVYVGGSFTRIAGVTSLGYAVLAGGSPGGGSAVAAGGVGGTGCGGAGGGGSGGGGGGSGGGGSGGGGSGGGGSGGGGGTGGTDFPPNGAMPSGWLQPSGSNAPWVVASDAANEGTMSLKSGAIAAGQKSELAVQRNFDAGNVTFARKVSGGTLEFYVDGVQQGSWSGVQDWASVTFSMPAGAHTLLWRYTGSNSAWIDSVTLPGIQTCIGHRCTPR